MKVEQVKFKEFGTDNWVGGIVIDDRYLICGCCGGVYDLSDTDDSADIEEVVRFETWVDISYEIKGED